MAANTSIPAGFQEVSDQTVLASVSASNSVLFRAGDTFTVTDTVVSKPVVTKDGKAVTDEAGNPKLSYYVLCDFSGKLRPIHITAFRRRPRQADEFYAKTSLMKDLSYCQNAYDAFETVKNKRITVTELVEGETKDFDKSTQTETIFRMAKFPVFGLAE